MADTYGLAPGTAFVVFVNLCELTDFICPTDSMKKLKYEDFTYNKPTVYSNEVKG